MQTIQVLDLVEKKSSSLKIGNLKSEGKYPVFGAQGIAGYLDTFQTDKEAIAVIKDGAGVGRVTILPAYSSVIGTMQLLIPKNGANIKYLFYLFKYLDLGSSFSGATIPHIYFKDYSKINVKKFDPTEQEIIGLELTQISDLIKNCELRLFRIDELVQSKFNQMFGNEDSLDKHTLESLTTKVTDGSHNPPKGIKHSEYIMASSQNVFDVLDLTNVKYLTKEDFDRENKRTDVEDGDVLFTIVGTIGRTHIIKNEKIVFQRSVAVIKPKRDIINPVYLKYFLESDYAKQQIEKEAHGVAQMGIYLSDLKKITVLLPEKSLQDDFEQFVNRIESMKNTIKKQRTALEELLNSKIDYYFDI